MRKRLTTDAYLILIHSLSANWLNGCEYPRLLFNLASDDP